MKKKIKEKRLRKIVLVVVVSLLGLIISLSFLYSNIIFGLVFQVGYSSVYKGNNKKGNQVMNYAISKMKNPSSQVYRAFSVQNTKNGNYNISISALDKAYKMNPKEEGAYYGWVLLYYYHDYEKALSILNTYDNYTPKFSDAPMGECIHYLKGLAHMQLQDYKQAIHEFNVSIDNTSQKNGESWVNYAVLLNKGRCLYEVKRYEEAIQAYKKALTNYGKCAEAYYFMGVSQLELKKSEKACQNFNTALGLINKGYKSSDNYVELFHEIYDKQVEESILNNCIN